MSLQSVHVKSHGHVGQNAHTLAGGSSNAVQGCVWPAAERVRTGAVQPYRIPLAKALDVQYFLGGLR